MPCPMLYADHILLRYWDGPISPGVGGRSDSRNMTTRLSAATLSRCAPERVRVDSAES